MTNKIYPASKPYFRACFGNRAVVVVLTLVVCGLLSPTARGDFAGVGSITGTQNVPFQPFIPFFQDLILIDPAGGTDGGPNHWRQWRGWTDCG